MRTVKDRLAARGVPQNELLKLEEFKLWRVVINDRSEGIVVLDIEADTEAEAKGKAETAAKTHLKCAHITGMTAMNWTELPDAWKRVEARRH